MTEVDQELDGAARAALARLTEREKDCLRRRLRHQTAKEMALDLGVSPHAVEKRLKMARTKLGLSSSLEAARLLAHSERYQQAGPQSSDLESTHLHRQTWRTKPVVIGGIAMTALAATLVVIAAFAPSSPEPPTAPEMRKASWDETATFLSEGFHTFDKDNSGFLDPREASVLEPRDAAYRDKTLPTAPAGGQPDPAAEAKWMAKLDTNRDGRVSRGEYVSYMMPWTLLSGIPKGWKSRATEVGRTSADQTEAPPSASTEPITERFPPSDFVNATPAEILVVIQSTFHTFDKDHSGFLEGDESPMIVPENGSPVYRRDKNGKVVPTGEVVHQTAEQLRANFYKAADQDNDGKVSFAEFRRWDAPNLARLGLPAKWKADIDRPIAENPDFPDRPAVRSGSADPG